MNIIGDVEGRICILIDDIVEFGRHPVQRRRGADGAGRDDVVAYFTHGVLSGGAVARVERVELTELVVTDTIYHGETDRQGRQDPPPDHRSAVRPRRSAGSPTKVSVSSLFD